MKDPEHIGAIIKRLLSERKWDKCEKGSLPFLRWREIVGSQIAKQAQPESLEEGVLRVRVENSVWLNHLRFLGEELRQKLNKEHSSPQIKEIRFRQGPLDSLLPPSPSTDTRPTPARQIEPEAPPELNSEQQALLETITDRELRQALEALFRRQKGRFDT